MLFGLIGTAFCVWASAQLFAGGHPVAGTVVGLLATVAVVITFRAWCKGV